MCGRYTISNPSQLMDELEDAFDGGLDPELSALTSGQRAQLIDLRTPEGDPANVDVPGQAARPPLKARFNIAPTQAAPAVRVGQDSRVRLAGMTWGFSTSWGSATGKSSKVLINARIETVTEKRSFSSAFARRRCLIPADGFFEWSTKGPRQPHWFSLGGGESRETTDGSVPLCFAGIWQDSQNTEKPGAFALLTTAANERVRPLHHRMPIALPKSLWHDWMAPQLNSEDALAMLHSEVVGAQANWRSIPVSSRVNKVANDDPELIAESKPEPHNLPLF